MSLSMLSPTALAPSREIQLGLRIEYVKLVRMNRELDFRANLHLLVRWHQGDDLVALGLGMDQLLVAQVLDDIDLCRDPDRTRADVAVQLEVLRAEADQQVPAAVLRRCSGGRA